MGIIKCLGFFKASDMTDTVTIFPFFVFLWETQEYSWILYFLTLIASVLSLISKIKK